MLQITFVLLLLDILLLQSGKSKVNLEFHRKDLFRFFKNLLAGNPGAFNFSIQHLFR